MKDMKFRAWNKSSNSMIKDYVAVEGCYGERVQG